MGEVSTGRPRALAIAIAIAAALSPTGCDGGGGGGADDAGSGARDASGGGDASRGDAGSGDAGSGDAGSGGSGGAAYRGEVLFTESFEDGDFAGRGWYDESAAALAPEHAPVSGSAQSFACRFAMGATTCPGRPGRHALDASESVYFSYWVQYAPGWVGSGRPYHPHEFHFLTDVDGDWIGPSTTHLTTYVEQVGLVPMLAIQDSLNVDPACVLRNDDSFVGCGGSFEAYAFTEMRSVASCNGLVGDVDGRDCFPSGGGWYSARSWRASAPVFETGRWHFVEAYFRMNTIAGGVGRVDGAIRMWVDGALVVSSDRVLLRTGANATMRFDQFLSAQYIGDGSPIAQTAYYDELVVARGVP